MINQFICGTNGDAMDVTVQAENRQGYPDWFTGWLTSGNKSDAGVSVNGYTALTHCPIWQGVNIISSDVGCVPLRLVRNKFDNQKSHPAWSLLRLRPNDLQTPSLWKETMVQWALVWGNGVSWVIRDGSRPVALIPLRPDCLQPELVAFEETAILLYRYHSPTTGRSYTFFPDDVIHIQGLTGDGVWGYPLFQVGKNTIGHGLALQKHGNSTFANGAVPGGVLEAPTGCGISKDPEARANLRREWNELHKGPDKSGAIAILWEGIVYKAMSQTNVDAQWLEAMKLDRQQAAGLLLLPPHKLGALEDSSVRSNLEEQNADYVQRTLTRWFNRFAEEFKRKLLTEKQWMSDEFDFIWDVDVFLKPDTDTLTTVADRLVKATIYNPNEAREMLGKPPRPGGDVYGSPAINPNQPNEKAGEKGPDSPQKPTPGAQIRTCDAHRTLLVDRLEQALKMEGMLLKQAAAGKLSRAESDAQNFVEWLDEFYVGDGKPSKWSAIVESIVGKSVNAAVSAGIAVENLPGIVNSWGIRRKNAILEACSLVHHDELQAAVAAFAVESTDVLAGQLLTAAAPEIEATEPEPAAA